PRGLHRVGCEVQYELGASWENDRESPGTLANPLLDVSREGALGAGLQAGAAPPAFAAAGAACGAAVCALRPAGGAHPTPPRPRAEKFSRGARLRGADLARPAAVPDRLGAAWRRARD